MHRYSVAHREKHSYMHLHVPFTYLWERKYTPFPHQHRGITHAFTVICTHVQTHTPHPVHVTHTHILLRLSANNGKITTLVLLTVSLSHKHAARWIRCLRERVAYAVNEVFMSAGVGGWWKGGWEWGNSAVKALKNKTKRSYITLCGDETGLSLKRRKVMGKLGKQIKIVHSARRTLWRERRESGKESDEMCCRTDELYRAFSGSVSTWGEQSVTVIDMGHMSQNRVGLALMDN